ncbi:MAG: hypothetical protein AAF081_12800 [Actinomycetota bacterium]
MTATTSVARSYRPHFLIAALAVIAVGAFFWFRPSAADQARLDGLQLDPTLTLPLLAGEQPELVDNDTNVASRSWDGTWSITEHTDTYALVSRRVNRYAEDLHDHVDASSWSITAMRCSEDRLVLTARQPFDGDWATLEITAWAVGPSGRMTVRSAVSAEAGTSLVVGGDEITAAIDCPEVR